MRKSLIGVVAVAAMLVVGAPRARATTADPHFDVISFSGSFSSSTGAVGTITPGVNFTASAPLFVIGLTPWPALPTHQDITDFHITFGPGLITTASTFLTRSISSPLTIEEWTPVLSGGDHTITFTAPPGVSLNFGDELTTAIFLRDNHGDVHFSGAFSAVPEPSSLLLFGSGLLLLVLIVSRNQLRTGQTA